MFKYFQMSRNTLAGHPEHPLLWQHSRLSSSHHHSPPLLYAMILHYTEVILVFFFLLKSPGRASLSWLLTQQNRGSDWRLSWRAHRSLPPGLGGERGGRERGGAGATGTATSLWAPSPASTPASQARQEPRHMLHFLIDVPIILRAP